MLERKCSSLYIVPNKQDKLLPENFQELSHDLREQYKLELARYEGQIRWKVLDFKISAKTGEGVWEILDEIYGELWVQSILFFDISRSHNSPYAYIILSHLLLRFAI